MADAGASPIVLRLRVTRFSRFVGLARAFVPLSVGISVMTVLADKGSDPSLPADERSGAVVGGVIFGGLLCWYGIRMLRPLVVRRPQIRLEPDHLVVEHSALFKEPLRLPKSLVRLAAVDDRPSRWRWFRDHPRFHLGGLEEGPEGWPMWLWSKRTNSPLPLLSHVGDIPNVAILFTAPVELGLVRRGIRPFSTRGPVHMPKRGQKARGLVARVRDADAAQRAFAGWGVARPLTVDDVSGAHPTDVERRSARNRRRWSSAALLVIVVIEVAGPLLAEPSDPASDHTFLDPGQTQAADMENSAPG